MTIPTMMNCEHQGEGWCLECVAELAAKRDDLLVACKILVEYETDACNGVEEYGGDSSLGATPDFAAARDAIARAEAGK